MRFCKFGNVDFEQEPTVFRDLLRSNFQEVVDYMKDFVSLFIAQIVVGFVMKGEVAEDLSQLTLKLWHIRNLLLRNIEYW
jgi:hypothetical protein